MRLTFHPAALIYRHFPFSPIALKHRERQRGCALRRGGLLLRYRACAGFGSSRFAGTLQESRPWEPPHARALRVVCLERLRASKGEVRCLYMLSGIRFRAEFARRRSDIRAWFVLRWPLRPSGYPYECRRLQHLHYFRVARNTTRIALSSGHALHLHLLWSSPNTTTLLSRGNSRMRSSIDPSLALLQRYRSTR